MVEKQEQRYQAGLSEVNATMKYDGIQRVRLLRKILEQMQHPKQAPKVIRVCGTNGKGSVISMVNNVLIDAHRNVGLFTSPFLVDPLEQIQINGQLITEEQFLQSEAKVKAVVSELHLDFHQDISEFESWFLIAVQFFWDHNVDVILLECGMGGELDATNAIEHSDYSLFTLVGLDHFKFLGNTLTEIATTKARMVRSGEVVVNYPQQRTIVNSILQRECEQKGAYYYVANDLQLLNATFDAQRLTTNVDIQLDGRLMELSLHMLGNFQIWNLFVVLKWWQLFNQRESKSIDELALISGVERTHMMGRFNLVHGWIIDGAHNRDAIDGFVKTTEEYFHDHPKTIIVGFLADKEVQYCVQQLQSLTNTTFITVTPENKERALPTEQLFKLFQNGTDAVLKAANMSEAIAIGNQTAGSVKMLVGSFYVVKAFLEAMEENNEN